MLTVNDDTNTFRESTIENKKSSPSKENVIIPSTLTKSEYTETITAMASSIESLQHQFSTTCSTMAGSLSNSVSMMKNINVLMEEFLKRNISIETTAKQKHDPPSLCITLIIKNLCDFPVEGLTFETLIKNSIIKPENQKSIIKEETSLKLEPHTDFITHKNIENLPLSKYMIQTTVRLPSPGTGKLLIKEYTSMVMLYQQCIYYTKRNKFDDTTIDKPIIVNECTPTFWLSGEVMRRLFDIPATKGLSLGEVFKIGTINSIHDEPLIRQLVDVYTTKFSDDGNQVCMAYFPCCKDMKDIIADLVMELSDLK